MTTNSLSHETISAWADDAQGPVALHLKQKLLSVEGEGSVIFPPTYVDIGYNIDTLSDGTKVALIDSVGSQANRMEPIFKHAPYSELVPQIEIEYAKEQKRHSLLDLAHRSADAVVYSCPKLAPLIKGAFDALKQRGNAVPLCELAPTSLVFGFWDSRESSEKRPRLVRSVIRGWDVQLLHAAAQFNSVWKALDASQQKELSMEAKKKKKKLSEAGFADAPSGRVLGGVLVSGQIERDVTVNLVALRAINGANEEKTQCVRRYLLALTLIAATAEIDLFLREGCQLRYADDDRWNAIPRRGELIPIDLASESAQKTLLDYAKAAVKPFREKWPKELIHEFDLQAAKKLLAGKTDDDKSVP